jgi:DNA replication and repair protein RecF|tara:strand:+ start:36959 stop:38068 length:1110 start_codon:yes stop_codon:yes gene_type:complete
MKIQALELQNFKNYQKLNLAFSNNLHLIVGQNGTGKTNLLDALHYLSFTKSAFTMTDNQTIKQGAQFFLIKGTFEKGGNTDQVICYQELRKKKIIKRNGNPYERFTDHIGEFPLVLSTPYDGELIQDASEVRRKWVDGCISQYDHGYLENLITYNKVLNQRNALLKLMQGRITGSQSQLLDTYDAHLIPLSKKLGKVRKEFIRRFLPFLSSNEALIVFEKETCTLHYQSDTEKEDFEQLFSNSRQKDMTNLRTNIGAHKDEYVFLMDGLPLKRFGSQGQQKSFLISLRLSQYDYLAHETQKKPLLLLDDIFDKLDDDRIARLTALLTNQKRFGQVFITDARKERASLLLSEYQNTQVFEINNGALIDNG